MRRFAKLLIVFALLPVAGYALSSISAYKTFTREILTSADLNASFSRLLDDGINPLILKHPGDSTKTVFGAFDTLVANPGPNITVKFPLASLSADDSLNYHLAHIRRANADTVVVGLLYGQFGSSTTPLQDTTKVHNLRVVFSSDGSHTTFLKGIDALEADSLTVSGLLTVDTLTVTGLTTLDSLTVTGPTTLDTLTVTGPTILDSLTAPGLVLNEANDLRDTIGVALTDSLGYKARTFNAGVTVTVNGTLSVDTLSVTGPTTVGTLTSTSLAILDTARIDSARITLANILGGTVTAALNGTLGATTPASVAATTLTASSTLDVLTATNFKLGSVAYTGTMANLNILRDDSMADALHRHSELSASDGTPNPAVQVDTPGNVGIGATPEAWHAAWTAAQFGGTGALSSATTPAAGGTMTVSQNMYRNTAGAWSYIVTDEASRYVQNDGRHLFVVATSDSADAATSGNEQSAFTIDVSGNVGIGGWPAAWAATMSAMQVGGSGSIASVKTPAAGNFTALSNNWYLSGDNTYIIADEACRLVLQDGTFVFQKAGSGTGVISWTTALAIANNGNSTFAGNILPAAADAYDLGSVATPMDSLFSKTALVVGDIPFLDTLHPSDLAQIRAIRGSGVIDPVTGLELVDDNTLPKVMMHTHRKDWVETVVTNIKTRIDTIVTKREEIKRIDRDTLVAELDSFLDTTWVARVVQDSTVVTLSDTALTEVFVSADTALVPHKKGDLVLSSSGKPFYDISATFGVNQGAIRELADIVDSLEARTDAQDVLIANLLSRVTKLEGR